MRGVACLPEKVLPFAGAASHSLPQRRPPRQRGDCHHPGSTLYHTCSAPAAPGMAIHHHHHFSRNAVRYVPVALYSHFCGRPVLRGLGKSAVFLLMGQQSKLCLKGLGLYFPLSFNCSFFWLVGFFTGIWGGTTPSSLPSMHHKLNHRVSTPK